jgi:hypothetical protein
MQTQKDAQIVGWLGRIGAASAEQRDGRLRDGPQLDLRSSEWAHLRRPARAEDTALPAARPVHRHLGRLALDLPRAPRRLARWTRRGSARLGGGSERAAAI